MPNFFAAAMIAGATRLAADLLAPRHGTVRLRTDARGNLLKRGNLATFGKSSHKRVVTRGFRTALAEAHTNHGSGQVDAEGQAGLDEYDQVLRQIQAALEEAGG